MNHKLSFSGSDCIFDASFGINEKPRLQELSKAVFDAWQVPNPPAAPFVRPLIVQARFSRRDDGRSTASVFQLDFVAKDGGGIEPGSFVLKLYSQDPVGAASAARELQIAKLLSLMQSHYFASGIVELSSSMWPNVVVYHHARNFFGGESPENLEARILSLMDEPTSADEVANGLKDFLTGVKHAFDNRLENAPAEVSGRTYLERLTARIVPRMVLDYRRVVRQEDGSIVLTWNDSGPFGVEPEAVSPDIAVHPERCLDESKPKWVQLHVVPVDVTEFAITGRIVLAAEGRLFWLLPSRDFDKAVEELFNLETPIRLVFNTAAVKQGRSILGNQGFDPQAQMDWDALDQVLSGATLTTCWRHSDLHTKNILCGTNRMVAIDLAGVAEDLAAVAGARLETSIWYKCGPGFQITEKEASTILNALDSPATTSFDTSRTLVGTFYKVLRAIRDSERGATNRNIVVAYASQTLIHQRHAVTIDRERAVHESFQAVARHWLKRLRSLDSTESGAKSAEDPLSELPDSTVGALWQRALTDTEGVLTDRAVEILRLLSQTDKAFREPLLPLQEKVWQDQKSDVFSSDRNVILAAPTGAGKTTLAEIFLLRPALLNTERKCALYIAPTRALTQARYRDLLSRFGQDPSLADGIIISTGEDNDHDHRLAAADFSIACLVFEKANVLFSLNPRLLRNVACVVVDEVHMLADLHRGPTLEMALTKVREERKMRDANRSRTEHRENARLVFLTTEDDTGRPARRFLGTVDPENPADDELPPLRFQDGSRPITAVHHVVVAGADPQTSLEPIEIVRFDESSKRYLKDDALRAVASKVSAGHAIAKRGQKVHSELHSRVISFVAEQMTNQPNGYRLLAFLPGRSDVEIVARGLLAKLGQQQPQNSQPARPVLQERIDRLEDRKLQPLLSDCLKAGIFIHHSDIDRTIREEIERICGALDRSSPPQLILSTETLSYGVNLAVQDVLLSSVRFNTQDREGVRDQQPLTSCAYHNMVGRAGRFGRTLASTARVFIIIDRFVDPYLEVVKRYYVSAPALKSVLFYSNDIEAIKAWLERTKPNNRKHLDEYSDETERLQLLASTSFTYPFSRAILDGLRHKNIVMSKGDDGNQRKAVPAVEVFSMLQRSIYGEDVNLRDAARERRYLQHGIDRVLDHCCDPQLRLTASSSDAPPKYTLTPRGDSVIDTGTELATVEPLLRFVSDLRSEWKQLRGPTDVPVELYIPCLIALDEVRKQYIRYCPECKVKNAKWAADAAAANDRHVESSITKLLNEQVPGAGMETVQILTRLLRRWLPPKEISSAYEGGTGAAVLRYYGAVLAWIGGHPLVDVQSQVEASAPTLDPDRFGGTLRSFRQLTELLHYKARCLARLLSKDDLNVISLSDEVRLYQLASRIRYGCSDAGIPMFWPQSSSFTRPEASALLGQGITPEVILADTRIVEAVASDSQLKPERFEELRSDLKRFVVADFRGLKSELSSHLVGSEDVRDVQALALWQTLLSAFQIAVNQFGSTDRRKHDLDSLVTEVFSKIARDSLSLSKGGIESSYRVRLEVTGSAVRWIAESRKPTEIAERPDFEPIKTLGIRSISFGADWSPQELKRILEHERATRNLVLVFVPWLPVASSLEARVESLLRARLAEEATTSFVSGAAFATLCTLIVRGLVVSPEPVFQLLSSSTGSQLFTTIGVKQVYNSLEGLIDWPSGAMREALLRHFEVTR